MKTIIGKIAVVAILLVAVVVVINLKENQAISQKPSQGMVVQTMLPVESASAPVSTGAGLPRFVELGADKCVPCKMMQPVLDELRRDYPGKLQVDFIDVWKNPSESQKYAISAIPTQIIFDSEGKEVFRHIGFFPKDKILVKLQELGISLNKED